MAIIKENLYLVKTVETAMPLTTDFWPWTKKVAQGPSDLELNEHQKKILHFEEQLAVLQEEIKIFRQMFWGPDSQSIEPEPPASPISSSSSGDSASTVHTDFEEE